MAQSKRGRETDAVVAPAHFLIVESRFYDEIGALLLAGAIAAFEAAQASFDVIRVPGALEVPIAMAMRAAADASGIRPYAGAIGLGCIMRGETYHFEVVANESARGLMEVGIALRLPIGNGILTVETEAQALKRADPAGGDKGGEAARAALALWRIGQDAGVER
jgi:6,7-dimethyl-8-ribityllumazine synthase